MDSIKIIKLNQVHLPELVSISRQTFIETFTDDNDANDMQIYLDGSFNLHQLGQELSNPDAAFYFALWNDQPIGYLKINFKEAQTEMKEPNSIEIERIYVLKLWYGKGVGQLLYNTAVDKAKRRQANYIWLGVWEKNKRAIQFYQKNGFEKFGEHIFKLGNDPQTDILMKLILK